MDIEEIKAALVGKSIEEVLSSFNWKNFEDFVAEIFAEHGFKVEQRVRFKTDRKYEIDLVASRNVLVLCVDCKQWSKGRRKTYGLRESVAMQEKRIEELKKIRKDSKHLKYYSIIITLFEEGIEKEQKTLIVPVWKLNSFLCNLEEYL